MAKTPDFSKMISELLDAGWTQVRIAEEIGISQVQVSRLYRGERSDPLTSTAIPLMELHKREMNNLKRRERRKRGVA